MVTVQVGSTFHADLASLGLEVPDNTVEIEIRAEGYNEVVEVLFTVSMPGVGARKVLQTLHSKTTGKELLTNEFYELMKDVVKFPDELTGFRIIAKPDEIVMLVTSSALPEGSMKCLSDYQLA